MVLFLGASVLLLHLRDRDRDRILAWERGAATVRLQGAAIEAELTSLLELSAEIAQRDEVRTATGDAEQVVPLLAQLLRMHRQLFGVALCNTSLVPEVALERDGSSGAARRAPPTDVLQRLARLDRVPAVERAPGETANQEDGGPAGGPLAGLCSIVPVLRSDARVPLWFVRVPIPSPGSRGPLGPSSGSSEGSAAERAPERVLVTSRVATETFTRLARTNAMGAGWCALVDAEGHLHVDRESSAAEDASWSRDKGLAPPFPQRHAEAWERLRERNRAQVLLDEGLFSFARIGRERGWRWSDAGGPLLVSFVPADAIYAASRSTLRRMLVAGSLVGLVLLALAWRLAFAEAGRRAEGRRVASSRERLARLSRRLFEVQEDERRSISRDLHDEMGQLATALSIDLQRAEKEPDHVRRSDMLARARASSDRMLASIHDLSARLRTSVFDDLGLQAALETLCEQVRAQQGFELSFACQLRGAATRSQELCLYRCVQEAMTNVARHAYATRVEIDVREDARALTGRVWDDGRGFDASRPSKERFGLVGMRERVELEGGTLELHSGLGQGTEVLVRLPLSPKTRSSST